MIQLTCGACGEAQAFAEADIPPGGKTVICQSCKSRIPLPNKNAATVMGIGGGGAAPSPAMPSAALPDLPTPRRPKPLGSLPSKPAPPSGLALADLPAPKSATDLPTPKLTSLPPKLPGRPTLNDVSPPPPRSPVPDISKISMSAIADGRATLNDISPPPPNKQTITDLPTPRVEGGPPPPGSRPGFSRLDGSAQDLPAPKRPGTGAVAPISIPAAPPPMPPPLPVPPTTSSQPDLLAPKRKPEPMTAGRPPPPTATPKATTTGLAPTRHPAMAPLAATPPAGRPASRDLDLDDLLSPAATARGLPDLPSPTRDGGASDQLRPRSGGPNLPEPRRRGNVTDLPQPAQGPHGSRDLPAPKGFFDDLPQPAQGPRGSSDLPAPKGFFADLPQPGRPSKPDVPAPKGFFDDLPQRARNQSGLPTPASNPQEMAPVATARGHALSVPPPTADDLFEDMTPPPSMPPALDLDELDLGAPLAGGADSQRRPKAPSSSPRLRAGGTSMAGIKLEPVPPPVDGAAAADVPMLDLGDGADFAGVDLPSTPPPSGVSFKPSRPGDSSRHEPMQLSTGVGTGDLQLDVEESKPKRVKRPSLRRQKAATRAPATRRSPAVLLVLLVLAAAAAGGFYFFQRWQKQQKSSAVVADSLSMARAEMMSGTPGHWNRAEAAARAALELDGKHAEASGLAAQALFAAALDDGGNADHLAKRGRQTLDAALGEALLGPELTKAQGLRLLADGKAQFALDRFLGKLPAGDANGQLYQGWARLAAGDHKGAIEAFDRSAKALPKRALPAVYGRAQARLALGDRAGAKADFALVLEQATTHVGAQVGLAAAAETPAELAAREKDLLALLQTKDIAKADPRIVARAWTLAGDDASRGSRTDAARDRYRKALEKAPLMIGPLRGLAELELREGKLDAASDVIAKALTIAPDDVELSLVATELALRKDNFADAEARITALQARKPPLTNPADKTRLFLLAARWHESQGRLDDALAACEDAIATAGDDDINAPLAAATLLGKLADKDPAKAAALRARADKMLDPLAAKARKHASVAVSLGIGYLAAGNPLKAETWLRQAIAARPQDIDAHFQLAEALSRQDKRAEALAILRKAYDLEPTRSDVGLQLARRYEEANRSEDATAMYDGLVAGTDVSIATRARAGRFFARIGRIDKARLQGDEILAVDTKDPAGLYLKGMGLLVDGKLDEARRRFQDAVDAAPEAQYNDALGRALELSYRKDNDPRFRDDAIRVYAEAAAADPTLFNPFAGQGRLHLDRKDGERALVPLLVAHKQQPRDVDVQYHIGLAYQFLGRAKEAIQWQSRSLQAKPRASGYWNVGSIYYEAENMRGAASYLAKATVLGEKDEAAGAKVEWLTDAYFRLGAAHSDLRNNAAAAKAWQNYLDRRPTDLVKVDKIKREMLRLRR